MLVYRLKVVDGDDLTEEEVASGQRARTGKPLATRTFVIPGDFRIIELQAVIAYLVGFDPDAVCATFEPSRPKDTESKRINYGLFDQDGEYVGNGITLAFSGLHSNGELYWYKDTRTFTVDDMFVNLPDEAIVRYQASQSMSIGCAIALVEVENWEGRSEDWTFQEHLERNSGSSGGGFRVLDEHERYKVKRLPQLGPAARRMDAAMKQRNGPGHRSSKCGMCSVWKYFCQVEGFEGCQNNSGIPCCMMCRGADAWLDKPLYGLALQERLENLEIQEQAEQAEYYSTYAHTPPPFF